MGDRLADLAIMLRQRKVEGLLIVGDNQGETPSITASAKLPTVYVHGPTTNSRDVVHLVDDFAGAVRVNRPSRGHRAVTHRPHNRPRLLPGGPTACHGDQPRPQHHGLALVSGTRYGPWSQRWASQAARDVLDDVPDVDAIACGSDQIAAAVLETVTSLGRKVPEDIAITGYDNWAIFAEETDPPLTTIDMDLEHFGAAAVSDLFAIISGTASGLRYPLPRGHARDQGINRQVTPSTKSIFLVALLAGAPRPGRKAGSFRAARQRLRACRPACAPQSRHLSTPPQRAGTRPAPLRLARAPGPP